MYKSKRVEPPESVTTLQDLLIQESYSDYTLLGAKSTEDLISKAFDLEAQLENAHFAAEQDREMACREMDEMAKEFRRQDEERRRLWGNKYPPVLGAKPPEKVESVNPVKTKKGKGRR